MAEYGRARQGNNHAAIRMWADGLWALQLQTESQRQRRAKRDPGVARCAECGAAIPVRRRPPPGVPVYCRDKSRCKTRSWRRRQAAAVKDPGEDLAVQAEPAPEPRAAAPEPAIRPVAPEPDQMRLWMLAHGRI